MLIAIGLCLVCVMGVLQVIKELDHKKDEALQATWQKVDADFGSIFSSLLPGARARVVKEC